MLQFLQLAAQMALPTHDHDQRSFWLGAVGLRKDGATVMSRNGAVSFSTVHIDNYQQLPNSHAEGRVLRKLGKEGIIFVARISRRDGSLAMAKCCPMCQIRVKAAKVSKVFYTIDNHHYGIWYPQRNFDKVLER